MFVNGSMLYLYFPVVLFALLLYRLAKERRSRIYRFVQKSLVPEMAGNTSRRVYIARDILAVIVIVFVVLSLARPQWGFEWQDVRKEGLDIFIAIDTSKSMLTEDVRPNRLERAKLAVKDLLKKLKGDRIGLIAFAGDAFLTCPLTTDYNGLLLSLDDLSTSTIPRGGTNIGEAIQVSLKGYDNVLSKYKVVVIMTDGENVEGDPIIQARAAAEKKVRIYTIGIGTREGELVRIINDKGESEFVKDSEGNIIKSRLNENLLKQIAATAGGAYVRSSGADFGLDYLYESQWSHLEKRSVESRVEKKYHDRFEIPLLVALLCLIIDTLLSTRKRKYA